jgi:hypothetical protein
LECWLTDENEHIANSGTGSAYSSAAPDITPGF